jgi:hypothetical protein
MALPSVRGAQRSWQQEPELACVRDPSEVEKRPAHEREEFLALWADVADLLARM